MLPYPHISPYIIKIGPLQLRWYGLMYVLGFLGSYLLMARQSRARIIGLQGNILQNLILFLTVGLIAGARLGYLLLYQYGHMEQYLRNPLEIIAVWHGGMSFHGGLAGALIAGLLFCRRHGLPVWEVADIVIVTVPVGLGLGRLGNFINAELVGRAGSVPWAMVFPGAGPIPRHPSQIYEAALEGLFLFVLLWSLKDRGFRSGAMVCWFLGGYGILRFMAEFFREPDPQIGLFWDLLTMGQILCVGMIIASLIIWPCLPRRSFASTDKGR